MIMGIIIITILVLINKGTVSELKGGLMLLLIVEILIECYTIYEIIQLFKDCGI